MKKTTLYLFYFLSLSIYGLVRISGTVYDQDNIPLEEASVYINNTSIGTTTNNEGFFELTVKEGTYEIIVSYVGFETKKYPLNTKTYKNPIQFKLVSIYSKLDEVVIKKKVKRRLSAREKVYKKRFEKKFLGESKLGKNCELLNENALDFEYGEYSHTLEAWTSEPLQIINKNLGYKISYDLIHFKLTPTDVNYLGNVRYEELQGSEKDRKKWKKNRLKAYRGSTMHFLRSVMKGTVKEEGFVVDQFERKPNAKRPSYKEIVEAKKLVDRNAVLQRDPFRPEAPDSKVLKAKRILERSKLPEFIDKVTKKNLDAKDYTLIYEGEHNLVFSDYLRVTYTKEATDRNYDAKKRNSKAQISLILLYKKVVEIRKSGIFKKPLDVFLQGYWAFEKVGDALPLDYDPEQ